mgnify:CR=1 FL=1
MIQAELKDRLWEHMRETPGLTRFEFLHNLHGWMLDAIYDGDEIAAIFIVKGAEFHFVKLNSTSKANKAVLKKYPGELIAKYGYAETHTPKTPDFDRQHRFNKIIGFFPVREDDSHVYYRIEKLRI